MKKKEKIRWICSIVFFIISLLLSIVVVSCGIELLMSPEYEAEDLFSLFCTLLEIPLTYVVVFIVGMGAISSGLLGAFFSYYFKDSEIKYVKVTCMCFLIVISICVVISSAFLGVLLF